MWCFGLRLRSEGTLPTPLATPLLVGPAVDVRRSGLASSRSASHGEHSRWMQERRFYDRAESRVGAS